MKAYNIHVLTIMVLALTLTTVGCGRAKLKALKKDESKEFVTTKNTETEIQTETESESVVGWKDKNSEALREELSQADTSQATQVVTQEAVLARKIKNLDFRLNADGDIQISIRIDEKGKYSNNPSLNEQKIVLRKLSDIEKVRFSRTENDVFVGSNGKIEILVKKENESGLYSADIREKGGTSVIALIRINSTLIGIANDISNISENDTLSELFKAEDTKIKTNIVQLYSKIPGQDAKGVALDSAANKIKVFSETPSLNTKFYIKGFMSESSDQPSQAKLFARAISESDSSVHAALLNELYSDIGNGAISLQTYTHTKENTYNLIYINDDKGLRAIDADILRMSLMYKDSNSEQRKLVVNLKFVDSISEEVASEQAAQAESDAQAEAQETQANEQTQGTEVSEAEGSSAPGSSAQATTESEETTQEQKQDTSSGPAMNQFFEVVEDQSDAITNTGFEAPAAQQPAASATQEAQQETSQVANPTEATKAEPSAVEKALNEISNYISNLFNPKNEAPATESQTLSDTKQDSKTLSEALSIPPIDSSLSGSPTYQQTQVAVPPKPASKSQVAPVGNPAERPSRPSLFEVDL